MSIFTYRDGEIFCEISLLYIRCLIVLFITCTIFKLSAKEKSFHLVAGVYPPYTIDNGEIKGLNIEIIRAAFAAVNYSVTIEILPFSRAMHYAQSGKADGLLIWHTKDREKWFQFSSVISESEVAFYKSKTLKFDFNSMRSLMPYSIGTVANYAYIPDFLEAEYLNKDVVGTDRQNITKLIFGRVDIVLIDKRMANYIVNTEYPEHVKEFDWAGVLQREKYYLAISKLAEVYQQKLTDFNLGLKIITDNGTRAAIEEQYQ